jgi:integrase
MFNTPDSPAKTPVGYTTQGGNFWTLITPEIWKVLHAVLQAFQSDYVLPIRSRKKAVGDAHMEAVTLNAAFNKFWKTYVTDKCQRFTPHDLRSTARSHLSRLGVELLIAERCLNHSLGGLIAIYDQHDYLDERRIALEKLSEFLVSCESS